MSNDFVCGYCHKHGRGSKDHAKVILNGVVYHYKCFQEMQSKQIICPNCNKPIKDGEGILLRQGCLPRHSNLNCHLKGK